MCELVWTKSQTKKKKEEKLVVARRVFKIVRFDSSRHNQSQPVCVVWHPPVNDSLERARDSNFNIFLCYYPTTHNNSHSVGSVRFVCEKKWNEMNESELRSSFDVFASPTHQAHSLVTFKVSHSHLTALIRAIKHFLQGLPLSAKL